MVRKTCPNFMRARIRPCRQDMHKRRFIPGAVNHCFQKTAGEEVLFYNVSDYLACFTFICASARRHRVSVLSLVLMPDHLHHCTRAQESEELSAFVQEYTTHFASMQNRMCHHPTPLFLKPFGSAPKMGDKSVRTALIYLGNNGPERKLSALAAEYRWSFLAYYHNDHPFSEPLRLASASKALRRAVSLVRDKAGKNQPLRYQTLQWLFKPLGSMERQQLADFIVTSYNVIDYEAAIAYFGSYEAMLEAMRLTKGSEHEIEEKFVGWDDKVYAQMTRSLMAEKGLADIHDLFLMPEADRHALIPFLETRTVAPRKQILKFLRLPVADPVADSRGGLCGR